MASKAKAKEETVPCSNCGGAAQFTLGDSVNVINYCQRCLPAHFTKDAAAGNYPLVTP